MKLGIFYAVTMIYWFALYMYVPILGPYVEYAGGSLQMVGLVVGSYGFTQMILRIPLGIWSDRLQKRRVFISAGLVFALVSSLGMGVVSNPWLILLFRSFAGAAAATWVTFTVLFSSYFKPHEAPKAMGIIVFFTQIGQMIATTLGGFTADLLGWQAPFIIGAAVGGLGLLLSTQIAETQAPPRQAIEVKELMAVGRDRTLLTVSFLAILFQCLMFSTVYGFTPMHAVGIGASNSQLSILALFSSLPAAFMSLRSGGLAQRFGERRILVTAFLLIASTALMIPFIKSLTTLYITQALGGFGRGLVFPILMGLSIKSVPGDKRATAMGFFQSIYSLGMFGGPVIVGLISEWFSLAGGFVTVSLIGFAAALLTLILLKMPREAVAS